jgi:hypothetical protein
MDKLYSGLSQVLAEQRRSQLREQAATERLLRSTCRPRRRRQQATRRWWQLIWRPVSA